MKLVRYAISVIVCLLAVYGGYQLYIQRTSKTDTAEDFLNEMRASGIDVGSGGDSKEAITSLMQSDLGTPTASYGMSPGPLPSSLGGPSPTQTAPSGTTSPTSPVPGLPPSLRSSAGAGTVVMPEAGTTFPTLPNSPDQNQPDQVAGTLPFEVPGLTEPRSLPPTEPPTESSTMPPTMPLFETSPNTSPQPTFNQAPFQPGQPSDATIADAPTSHDAAPFDVSTSDVMPFGTTAATMTQQDAEQHMQQGLLQNSTQGMPQNMSQNPAQPEMQPSQQNQQTPFSQASPYTFEVAMPSGGEINTNDGQPESQPVVVSQLLPGSTSPSTPCVQEMAAYQPKVAGAYVQPLPPVNDSNDAAATAAVNPPVFIPRLNVTALPPVEDETLVAAVNPPLMPVEQAMPNAPTAFNANGTTNHSASSSSSVPAIDNMAALAAPTFSIPTNEPVQEQQPLQDQQAMPMQTAQVQPPVHSQMQVPQQELPMPPVLEQSLLSTQAMSTPMMQTPQTTIPQTSVQQPTVQTTAVMPLPQSQDADIAPEVVLKVTKIGELLAQNEAVDAYEQLSHMYFYDEMTPQERQYVARHLDQLAGGLLFSKRHHVLEPPYVVKQGDTVESIASQYKITPELVRKLNGIPANENAPIGATLKVINGPLDARIYPDKHEMVVVTRGNYACRFPICVGSGYAGQEGTFTVQEKARDRAYQLAPGLGAIPPGDANNPLGNRWIELSKEQGTIGVHGTNSPQSIGTTRQSAGFFGLRDKDISEVYDMLVVGSNVTIVR